MHRECGTLVELNLSALRAVGKMKATITQRFKIGENSSVGLEPVIFDVDCDCRFHFFCFLDSDTNAWKVKYVKLIYEKDKLVPVDGKACPGFPRMRSTGTQKVISILVQLKAHSGTISTLLFQLFKVRNPGL